MRLFIAVVFLFFIQPALSQDHRFRAYRVEQGLPSDVIKSVTQDSLGFIWIATDDGLVKYDGLEFVTYSSALRSQYAKDFLTTHDGRLLAIGDLDLVEIQNNVDTVYFRSIIRGARLMSDSTLWFPKSIYEDRKGNIWLAEPQSALRWNGDQIKRFNFDVQHRSPVFIRSFTFFENDEGTLYAVSYKGSILRYDENKNEFIMLQDGLPANCAYVQFYHGKLLIGSGSGLFEAEVKGNSLSNLKAILPRIRVSHFSVASDASIWVSTFDNFVYRIEHGQNEIRTERFAFNFNGSNSIYCNDEGDTWVSTDKGLVLVQKNFFQLADSLSRAQFIEAITEDEQGRIYFSNKDAVTELTPTADGEWKRKVIYADVDGYFQSLQASREGLWASNETSVLLFKEGKLSRKWDFANEGNFIHDIFLDKEGNVWASQAGNSNVIRIAGGELTRYPIPANQLSEVSLVRQGPRGMYAAASGMAAYLFLKTPNEEKFVNISAPITFSIKGDFNIYDIDVTGDNVWIASTEGLLLFNQSTIRRIDLGEIFTPLSVSSVEVFDAENILFANSHGLFRYNVRSGEYWLYDENTGLPSNTITGRGIFVDRHKNTWVGTAFGIAYSRKSIIQNEQTAKPFCVGVQVNGNPVPYSHGVVAPYGSFVNLQFSSITFPENKIILQWRQGNDTIWHAMDYHEVSLSDLRAGKTSVHVRAKKNTGQGWSEPVSVEITTRKPYWQRAEFIFMVLSAILVIAWVSYSLTSRILNRRKAMLERLIDQRTRDLQVANEELVQRNAELDRFVYSASHDLSAPLKSILGLIAVSRMEKPGDTHGEYLRMMEGSVKKLENFISDVVCYSRNTRLPMKEETFQFKDLVQDVLDDHQYSPNYSAIEIDVRDETGAPMTTDVMRFKIILNNLISNAIKFHRPDVQEKPFVHIRLVRHGNAYVITVEDNGSGIDEKHTSHIFEMFYRASEMAQGSGLGLYILKETVLKLSGRVTVKSAVGVGTTFTVTIPAPEADN